MPLIQQYPALQCLATACDNLNIPYRYLDRHHNFIEVKPAGSLSLFFANAATPFNSDVVNRICADKEFTYLLLNEVIAMPATLGFFNPDSLDIYELYRNVKSRTEIIETIQQNFSWPLIMKRNAGQQGNNVFLCPTEKDLHRALKKIYNPKSQQYDYVALAQEYIKPKAEYRLIFFREKLLLAYEKSIAGATFNGNLSPLHWDQAQAIPIEDQAQLAALADFAQPIFAPLPVTFAGLDVIEDEQGKLWLIEINTRPGFKFFIHSNGEQPLIEMYEKILQAILAH